MEKNNFRVLNFLSVSKYIYLIAYIILAAGIFSVISKNGFKLGIDFAGGEEIRIAFKEQSNVSRRNIEDLLKKSKFDINITEIEAQNSSQGTEFFIYYQKSDAINKEILENLFRKEFVGDSWSILSESFVGPKIGKQFQQIAFYSTFITLIVTLFYIALRFQFGFGFAALTALIYDILLLLCFISFFNISFDIPILAGILTVVGYSLNDTIVIFDRIRHENKILNSNTIGEYKNTINLGITRSLNRTFLTTFTTLIVLFIMYFLGSSALKPMITVLITGVTIAVIATNFITPPILVFWRKKELLKLQKNKD